MEQRLKKPEWIKSVSRQGGDSDKVGQLLEKYGLNTVCDAANCPNCGECYGSGTATFMLLGQNCTRNCTFCNVTKAAPECVSSDEPQNVAEAAAELGLKHVVITSVTRDDLPDGGAQHFADTVAAIRQRLPSTTIEVLIPDFLGSQDSLQTVIDSAPDVINHNIETVRRLYPGVRPMAVYQRSLQLISRVKSQSQIPAKSGFMVGLGETEEEVFALLADLRGAGCDIVTIGQYLRPSKNHHPVIEYVHPDVFKRYHDRAMELGFAYAVSSPFARSSYKAHEELAYVARARAADGGSNA